MRLDDSFLGGLLWVKKTKYSKTTSCLFIYHHLIVYGSIKKEVVEDFLEIENRITIYNYLVELKIFIAELSIYLCQDIEIYYDSKPREFVLEKSKR